MAFEYQMLLFMTFFFLVAWVPASLAKRATFGFKWVMSNRDHTPSVQLPAWGTRADRSYNNLKDYFPGFVVAILLLGQLNKFDHSTAIAAGAYVALRMVHFIAYTSGNFPFRFVGFTGGMIANFYLLAKAIY
ncbi:MAG: MAPEG family protein [Bacteriovoracaceae bacterium]